MSRLLSSVVLACTAMTTVSAWPQFLSMVPNGGNVSFGVVNLGHKEGSILRHQFGRDFGVGRNWTKELCQRDSDNDGQTNGQELGDPCCVWSIGHDDLLAFTEGMSNPGNASSLADPSRWKNLDCTTVQKNANAKKLETSAPSAKSGASSVSLTAASVSTIVSMATVVLW